MSALCLPILSAQSVVSVVGGSHASADSPRRPTSTSNGASFISPKEGEIVHPGDTINIELTVDPDIVPAKALGIVSPMGDSNEDREGPPYSFTFTIPESDRDGASDRLIGFQRLALFGTVVGRKDYEFASTTVDVEEPDLPVSLDVVGPIVTKYIPYPLKFFQTGEDERIAIYARFPNGHEHYVTDSTYLSLASENPNVALVSDDGTVTSVGLGQTHILITYTLGEKQKQISLPVTVANSHEGLDLSPTTLDFGDVPSGTSSAPLRVTITNHTQTDIDLSKLEPRGRFLGWPGKTAPRRFSLPVIRASSPSRFSPIRSGRVHSNIFVPNSFTSISSIGLFGNGT